MSGRVAYALVTDDAPQLGSTCVAFGRLRKSTGDIVLTPTGTFLLVRDGVTLLDNVPMVSGVQDYGDGYLKTVIAANLMTRGIYTWAMTLTDPGTGYVAQQRGRFTLQ